MFLPKLSAANCFAEIIKAKRAGKLKGFTENFCRNGKRLHLDGIHSNSLHVITGFEKRWVTNEV